MTTATAASTTPATSAGPSRSRRPGGGIHGRQDLAGWLFVAPVLVILGLFLLCRSCMALWVSLTDWNGQGSPFSSDVAFVGADNYAQLFTESGLVRRDFMTSLRNNVYYVLLVVPLQTVLALALALVVNQKLKGSGFFRTAFYFPSVTSSVAISVVFLFLFTDGGAVNAAARLLRHRRTGVVLRPARRAPPARAAGSGSGTPSAAGGAHRQHVLRPVLVGLALRAERGHVRDHRAGRSGRRRARSC